MARHTLGIHCRFYWLGTTIPCLLPPLCLRTHVEPCCVLRLVTVVHGIEKNSFKAFMTIISDTFKVTHNLWEFGCLLMFAKATKGLCSVTHHQTGLKKKLSVFPFLSDFFETWSSLHCFVNFFVSEAEASNEAKNTGRDNTKSKRGEQHVLPKANPHANLWHEYAHNSLNSNKRSIFKLFSTWKIWLFSINFSRIS